MKTSQTGLNLICSFEGYREKAYQCPSGIWTIGYGTTKYPNGAKVKPGDTCTKRQAAEWNAHDLIRFEANVAKYDGIYRHNQNEFDALVSFAYNVGSIDGLTSKNGKPGARSKAEIAQAMPNYNKGRDANNQLIVLSGLVRRREAERALYIMPVGSNHLADKNPYAMPSATIRLQSVSKDIKWLQWELNFLGYPLVVDGKWGQKTQAALLIFQKNHRLSVDGLAGPKTKKALLGDENLKGQPEHL